MYAIMERKNREADNDTRDLKKGKDFFLEKEASKKSNTKVFISKQVSNSISSDIRRISNIISDIIIEGMRNGRE